MKKACRILIGLALAICCFASSPIFGQGTAFSYQGRLNDNGGPANGGYDLRFILFDADPGGSQQGAVLTNSAVVVTGGLFTVSLDFGQSFPGADRWLEIAVRTNGGGAFTTLSPRQKITTVPYAITAGNVTGVVPSSGLAGVYSGGVTFNNVSNQFSGNGNGLTNVNAISLGGLGAAGFWKIAGNSGTSSTHFLGTTDNQPLELRVNGQRALRVEPNTNGAANIIAGSPVNFVSPGVSGDTISGGGISNSITVLGNSILGSFSSIGGGVGNTIQSDGSSIAGGESNTISTEGGANAIGGGDGNVIGPHNFYATIAGGNNNQLQDLAQFSTISGGGGNVASGRWDALGGETLIPTAQTTQ